ncbi:MAG: aminopeptidase [Verrucomicrobiales bacterium VVV1]|nr:MAG: aminopeptidase [Verrucomicrobiales bacterium VVV1]
MRAAVTAFALLLVGLLSSCQTLEFYGQGIRGQVEIFSKSRRIDRVLADPSVRTAVKKQLVAVQGIREFASDHLTLPGDKSYGTYADLGRPYVTWVLYAAPEFSMKPKTWWYPTLGHLDYRGYFRESDTRELAARLKAEGYDVEVGGVDAYSTLGWFHDPVLNCFLYESDVDLAELIFHELTHRRVFRDGDTAFNEGLATAFAEEGVRRWLRHQGRLKDLHRYEERLVKREQFYRQIEVTRGELEKLYASGRPENEMRREKAATLKQLQDQLRELRRRWGGHGLESWLKGDLNNAHLVSVITYQDQGPKFRKLLKDCGGDPEVLFQKAKALPKGE